MIVKISKGEKGVADYLKTGKKRDSKLTRDEKDDRLPLAGNLDLIEMSERHQSKKKNKKYNYYHISLSFTSEEWNKLYESGNIDDLIMDFLKLTFPNHDIDELLFYAEAHLPIIKEEPYIPRPEGALENRVLNKKHKNGEPLKREPHIHLIVSFENMKFTHSVKTGGAIYAKGASKQQAKAVMAKSVEKFKRVVNDILSNKYGLNNIEPLGMGEDQLEKQYESFKSAAQKVRKGKEKDTQMKIETDVVIEPKANTKEQNISVEELLADARNSTADYLLRMIEEDESFKKDYYDRAKRLNAVDIREFLPMINAKFNITAKPEMVNDKYKVSVDGFKGTYNLTDLMCKIVYNGRKGALFHVVNELEQMLIELQANKNEPKITLSVSSDFNTPNKDPKAQVLNSWKTIRIEPYNLKSVLKNYSAISVASFKNKNEEDSGIDGITPTLIYDIYSPKFTINDAQNLLQSKGIKGFMYPTSYQAPDTKVEKFKLIIPTTKAPSLNEYDKYIKEITRELGLYNIVNNQSLYPSKFHYTPVPGSELVSISGKTLDNTRAIEEAGLKTDINNMDVKALEENLQKLRIYELSCEPKDTNSHIKRTSYQAISSKIPIKELIEYFDESTVLKEYKNHQILSSNSSRYLYLPEENTVYSFSQNRLYTPYIYIRDKFYEAARKIKTGFYDDDLIKKLGITQNEYEGFVKAIDGHLDINRYYLAFINRTESFKKYLPDIVRINYKCLIYNIKTYMKDWQDMQGFNKLKKCYKADKISLANDHISFGSLKITKQELYGQGLDSNFGAEQTKQPSSMIETKEWNVKSGHDSLER
ncbi:aminotransferase [Campylobacter concisus]|uniref:aminotransferase n=1 Tax=Campylobacter concisus TaxID=199 RepID=UPI0018AB5A55|nr:aminotransferase [Campylobacter concisus]QPH98636.1 aminotransferase [Campylobacter concisus]QPI00390.1 aminotransferase [Campylobacter concisus]